MCKDRGLHGYRTNHSLRTSAATRLYQAGVDEQLITEVTGHRSNAVKVKNLNLFKIAKVNNKQFIVHNHI
jgi:integrase